MDIKLFFFELLVTLGNLEKDETKIKAFFDILNELDLADDAARRLAEEVFNSDIYIKEIIETCQ